MSKYSQSNIQSESKESNTNEKKQDKGGNLNINLTLLSNKTSMETLLTMAKKQKIAMAMKSNESKEDLSKPSMYQSVTFNQNVKDILNNQKTLISSCSQSDGVKFMRAERKPIVANSTKLQGKLDIIKKLNNNLESRSTTNIFFNKNQQGTSITETNVICNNITDEGLKHQDMPKAQTKPLQKSSISTGLKSLFTRNHNNTNTNNSYYHKETVYEKTMYCIKKANSVVEFAYKETQNITYKETMEDMGKAIDSFNNNKNEGLFCLFDGHGGDAASKYLQEHYPSYFKRALSDSIGNIESALKLSFKNIDKELEKLSMFNVGSTGCVIYTMRDKDNCSIYTANIGDTRCSLISPMKYTRLTIDHRVELTEERDRIINSGGDITNDRVMGVLMLSRAFGDFELKPFGVSSEPHISKTVIDSNDKNQILVCASDGVWDVVNEEDIQNYIMFNNDTEELCKTIVKYAIAKGSWDNISCFAIKLT